MLSLDDLNARIRTWQFKLQLGDVRPPELPPKILSGGGLGYKTRSCVMLAENLLFIVADKVEEAREHFQHFARGLRLAQVLLEAPSFNNMNLLFLSIRMVQVEMDRLALYPWATQTSKLHFILHLIEQIVKHGATRNASCLSLERHYKVVKSKVTACFKNLSYSIALNHHNHQQWQDGALFEYKDGQRKSKSFKHTLKPLREVNVDQIPEHVFARFEAYIMAHRVYSDVKYGSARFTITDVFEVGNLEDWNAQFVQVQLFLTDDTKVLAVVQYLRPEKFDKDFGCYEVTRGDYDVVDFNSLENKFVLPCFQLGDKMYVNRKYSAALEYD